MNCGTRYNKIQTNILSTWNFRKVILVKRKLRTNSNSWKFGPHIAFIFKMAWSLVTKFSQPDEFSVGHQLVGQGQLTLISWSPDQIFSRNIFTAVFHMPQIWNISPCTTRSYSLVGNSQCQLETYTEVTPSINKVYRRRHECGHMTLRKNGFYCVASSLKCQNPHKP